jgi:hypothetical protein
MKRVSYGFARLFLLTIFYQVAWSQQPPSEAPPANVAGKWILYCNDPNGTTSSKYLDLKQNGNAQHLVVRTKTRYVLMF